MMRVAALYDIHGNLPALEAVLQAVRQAEVDRIVVGGDVLPGPMPRETLSCLLALDVPVQFIRGNGDREVLAQRTGEPTSTLPEPIQEVMRWTAQQLDPHHEEVIARWPLTLRVALDGMGDVLFCHATPRDDNEIFTSRTPEDRLVPLFEASGTPLVICGHTHIPFDRTIGTVRVVNAGSVGMPFGKPGASWLLLDGNVQLQHTPYDLAQAAARIQATDYPQAQAFATQNVLHPPSAETMLDVLTRGELKG